MKFTNRIKVLINNLYKSLFDQQIISAFEFLQNFSSAKQCENINIDDLYLKFNISQTTITKQQFVTHIGPIVNLLFQVNTNPPNNSIDDSILPESFEQFISDSLNKKYAVMVIKTACQKFKDTHPGQIATLGKGSSMSKTQPKKTIDATEEVNVLVEKLVIFLDNLSLQVANNIPKIIEELNTIKNYVIFNRSSFKLKSLENNYQYQNAFIGNRYIFTKEEFISPDAVQHEKVLIIYGASVGKLIDVFLAKSSTNKPSSPELKNTSQKTTPDPEAAQPITLEHSPNSYPTQNVSSSSSSAMSISHITIPDPTSLVESELPEDKEYESISSDTDDDSNNEIKELKQKLAAARTTFFSEKKREKELADTLNNKERLAKELKEKYKREKKQKLESSLLLYQQKTNEAKQNVAIIEQDIKKYDSQIARYSK